MGAFFVCAESKGVELAATSAYGCGMVPITAYGVPSEVKVENQVEPRISKRTAAK